MRKIKAKHYLILAIVILLLGDFWIVAAGLTGHPFIPPIINFLYFTLLAYSARLFRKEEIERTGQCRKIKSVICIIIQIMWLAAVVGLAIKAVIGMALRL